MGAEKVVPAGGKQNLRSYTETVIALGNAGAALALDCAQGNVFTATLNANTTVSFANPPAAGFAFTVTVITTQDGTGGRTVAWPGTVKWANGIPPAPSAAAAGVDVYTLTTVDGGASWLGFQGARGFA